MLIVATIGLTVNLISMKLLAGGSSKSLNVKGVYLEVLGDMLGSIRVIVAALLMMWKGRATPTPSSARASGYSSSRGPGYC